MNDLTDLSGGNPPEQWSAEQARQEHQDLQESNQQILNNLALEGVGIDTLTMLKMRLDYVTQFLVGDDEQQVLTFATGWERFLAKVLDGAEQQVRMAKLQVVPPHQQLSLRDGLRG
jgi:hypothetical protein